MESQVLFPEYDALKVKAIQIKSQVESDYQTALELKRQYDAKKRQLKAERESQQLQVSSIDVLKEIVDAMSQEHVQRIVELLTYGLQTIFFDKNYSVEVVVSDKRNTKTAEFQLVERTEDEVIRSPFNDGIGGGVLAIVGFILQVYYIGMLDLPPILFVDEGFSQVSSQYVNPLLQFINELADVKDFIFVLVTHDSRLMQCAVHTYEVNDGVVTKVN